jgi:hypothetical protein
MLGVERALDRRDERPDERFIESCSPRFSNASTSIRERNAASPRFTHQPQEQRKTRNSRSLSDRNSS